MVRLPSPCATDYRPRQPLESDFHRLIRQHFDDFRAVYPHRYASKFGFWRSIIDKAVAAFLKCGDLQHGFARARCPDCHHEFFVAFSCKQRCICPSCAQKRTLLFGLHVAEDVCRPVPHRQFVWTIPKRLRIFFRFHRGLLNRLPPLAWETVTEVYRSLLGQDALPGGVLAIQTFGSLIHFHPHIHGLITDGAFTPDGVFHLLPVNLTHEPFLRLWENKVFQLLLDQGRIEPELVEQMRSWRHSGFNVDRSVHLQAGDTAAIERLAQYMARNPFSLSRIIRITQSGKVLYKAERDHIHPFPEPASPDLFGGVARNFQVFEPLDFLAELTQHIPNKGEHLVRCYGCYSNKARGVRNTLPTAAPPCAADGIADAVPVASAQLPAGPAEPGSIHLPPGDGCSEGPANAVPPPPLPIPDSRSQPPPPQPPVATSKSKIRWAMLIQRIYQVDPLRCPKCGGAMKIIAFIEARQDDVIRKILQHCGLWHDPPSRAPPKQSPSPQPAGATPAPGPGFTREADPDFLDHAHRDEIDQPELPWEP